jgi:hypothetical protein
MRAGFLIGLLMFMGSQAFGYTVEQRSLSFVTDVSLASKYMMDGFKVGGDRSVWQLSVIANLYATGFSLMAWTALQTDRGEKQYDEQDIFLRYSHDFFNDSNYKLNFHGFYDYWSFPNSEPLRDGFGDVISNVRKHGNKVQLGISMPTIFPVAKSFLVPTYNVYYLSYWEQDRTDMFMGGVLHEFILDYFQSIHIFIPGATYQYAGLAASTNYNSGTFHIPPGLSHTVLKFETGLYALQSIFILSLNHQWTHIKEINPTNEFWPTFSFVKKF